jgi:hypothetical protein
MAFIVQNSRERGRVSQDTHAPRERVGNAHGAAFRFLAFLVQRSSRRSFWRIELPIARNAPVHRKNCMLWEWRALIITAPEKQGLGLPEAVHRREMLRPINLGGLVENRGEQLVAVNFGVEGIDEPLHILRHFDIAERIHEVT